MMCHALENDDIAALVFDARTRRLDLLLHGPSTVRKIATKRRQEHA